MGSSFIAYGAVLAIMLLLGQNWLIRRKKSQEFFDSVVIAAWGFIPIRFRFLTLDWSTLSRNTGGDQIGHTKTFSILLWVSSWLS